MNILKLAWRNIGRNRRRALITMASVFFAVFFCIIMQGFQTGAWEGMVDNMLRAQSGHIQIHAQGYWDDKTVENFMFMDATTLSQLENIENIENVSPRLETFAMASFETVSKGIAIIGVSPAKEASKSNMPSRIVQGNYLSETDDGILIGEGLSKYLRVQVGDTIALIGQGYHGASAAALFPVRGILKLMTDEMDNGMAYISISAAQHFIDMPDGYSGILITLKDDKLLEKTMEAVSSQLSIIRRGVSHTPISANQLSDLNNENYYAVYSWHFTMERLLQTAASDKAFVYVIMLIMYVIVGFGILGTVIMMTNERKREFCMMISLGMSRRRLSAVVAIELTMMSFVGVALALAVSLPTGLWFAAHPIPMGGEMADMYTAFGMEPHLPMSVNPAIFIEQMCCILVIALLTVIYPVHRLMRLKITTKV